MNRQGIIFIVSSPSGGGKTTLLRLVKAKTSGLVDSVSYTTRPMRPGEQDGVDYRFIDQDAFLERSSRGFFAEWAKVHRGYYGTSRQDLEAIIAGGDDAIMDIDVQGARQLKAVFPDAVTIFILPPTLEELERRLRGRGTEDEVTLRRRLEAASREMEALRGYDYLVVNHDLARSAEELLAIITAERCRTRRFDPDQVLRDAGVAPR
jgi:guanylate kinase